MGAWHLLTAMPICVLDSVCETLLCIKLTVFGRARHLHVQAGV
jgi:hypothetical protein